MDSRNKNRFRGTARHGLSLIETSIVLVIVGLIVGAVFVGQDLIKASQVRSALSDITRFTHATLLFRQQYNCLPGDCPTASARGLGTNGDGDERIGSPFAYQFPNAESVNFWWHLYNAGLITDLSYSTWNSFYWPTSRLEAANYYVGWNYLPNSYEGVNGSGRPGFNRSSFRLVHMSVTPTASCADYFCYTLSPIEAQAMDSKIDDGLPMSGVVRVTFPFTYTGQWFNGVTDPSCTSSSVDCCVIDNVTPNIYNVKNTKTGLCMPDIAADF